MPEASAARHGPAVSVVVPCYNERDNVTRMVAALEAALAGVDWEVIFVDDDSPDGTAQIARGLAAQDARVRCIRRVGRRGLASAVIEGALSASGEMVAVLDGDLQHDETILPEMLAALAAGADIAVGSRKVAGGSSDGLSSPARVWLSSQGIRLAQLLTRTSLNDPMSGFFALRRGLFDRLAPRLTGQGFKILLDLALASPVPLKVTEIPYQFRPRQAGESKLDALVMFQFAGLLIDKALHGFLPLRFMSFAAVGAVGVLVNLGVLLLAQHLGLSFERAQAVGTVVAMAANFQMNNSLTYRTMRLRRARYWRGLILFMLVCGLGGIANVGIAHALHSEAAGSTLSSAAGALVGVVWNYAISATLVWRAR